jgi:hypothetical protein
LPAKRSKPGLWTGRVLSQISSGFDGVLSTNCPPRHRADRARGRLALPHRMDRRGAPAREREWFFRAGAARARRGASVASRACAVVIHSG